MEATESKQEVGQLTGGYGKVLASAARDILVRCAPSEPLKVLVGHTAAIPIVHILEKHTSWETIFIFDDRQDNIDYQLGKINSPERVRPFRCKVSDLPEEVSDLDLVINPFGLQEYPGEEQLYALETRSRCKDDATLVTLDWGLTNYEDRFVSIPGISDEIAFSEARATPIFRDGWSLMDQVSYEFYISHTADQIEAIMPEHARSQFRGVVSEGEIINVYSTAIARYYRAK